ncbi:DeoR family transcriptional regulator, partial [Streptomyces sp. WAC05374]
MRESAVVRHDRLLALVRERGTARVSDLAAQLGVSPVTARRDVEALASRGLLDRVHGQVSWPGGSGGPGAAPGAAG